MNFLYKKSVLRRTPIFQEGGSNVFLGDAQPYQVAVPISGPSSNPAVSNKPIEINTTGIADQVNKKKDLAYKWAELQFRYKDLEYKEGKDYLDALKDVYKSYGTAEEMIKSWGGTGSLGQYQEAQSAYLSKMAEVNAKISQALGRRDMMGFSNGVAELGQIAIANTDTKFKTKTLDALLESARKGDMGYNTKRFMEAFYKHINNELKDDGSPYTFDEVLNIGTYAMGVKTQSKDVTTLLDNVFKKYNDTPFTSDVGVEVMPSGIIKETKKNYIPSLETIIADFKNQLLMTDVGRDFLYSKGINPDNPYSEEMAKFLRSTVEPIYNSIKEQYPEIFVDYRGEVIKDVAITEAGVRTIENKETKKLAEWEEKRDAFKKEIADKYGKEFAERSDVNSIILNAEKYEDALKRIEDLAKELGKTPVNTSSASGSIVPGTKDLPNTIEGIVSKFNIAGVDGVNTKIVDKDGTRYLVTNNVALKRVLNERDYASTLVAKDLWDRQVKERLGLTTEEWDFWPYLDQNANIYNLGPAPKATTAEAKLIDGDEEFIQINSTTPLDPDGYPRKQDFNNPVSKGLARRALPVLKDYTLWVTDTSDSNHTSQAQMKDKTAFDVNFQSEAGRDKFSYASPSNRAKIVKVIKGFQDQGLRAVYEVANNTMKATLLAESKRYGWGLTDDMIQAVPEISGSHFSVYCDDCTKYVAPGEEPQSSVDTGANEYQISADSGKVYIQDLIKNKIEGGEKVDISNE